MTRLPTVNPRKIINALQRAGFELRRQTGSHYVMKHPVTNHKTVVPIHPKDLNRNLMKMIIKPAGLTEEEFRQIL
jgi:predicted RNA binding protein YcfA (HicA-like mRNA interferase family)